MIELTVENLHLDYGTNPVLKGVSMELRRGEVVSLLGPSGSGKTTLLNLIGCVDTPTSGEVRVAGQNISTLSERELTNLRLHTIGFIFQSYHLINDLRVLDNVELPLLYRNITAKERRRLAEEALGKVGLSNRMKHFPTQLSGGQKQRVAIARAIVGQPEIILADEPTGNLDSSMGNEIMEILIQLNQTEKTTIVMVTHDEHMAKKTHRLVRLFDGTQVV